MTTSTTVHPVDERLPAGRLAALGLQHVLVMHAGAVAVPLVALRWTLHRPHALQPLLESGILLVALSAVGLNLFFNGARGSLADAVQAAKVAEAH